MTFKYTDPKKDSNYIGFESGIFCIYYNTVDITNEMFQKNPEFCLNYDNIMDDYGSMKPEHYDPRCRDWYKDQKKSPDRPLLTDMY